MNDKKKYPAKITLILRIAVALYLLYTVWGLRGAPASYTGIQHILFIAAMLVFFVVAIVLGGFSLKAFIRGEYERPEDEEDEE